MPCVCVYALKPLCVSWCAPVYMCVCAYDISVCLHMMMLLPKLWILFSVYKRNVRYNECGSFLQFSLAKSVYKFIHRKDKKKRTKKYFKYRKNENIQPPIEKLNTQKEKTNNISTHKHIHYFNKENFKSILWFLLNFVVDLVPFYYLFYFRLLTTQRTLVYMLLQ